MPAKSPAITRFWPKIQKTETCWLWTASRARHGYGVFNEGLAHRWAYTEFVGPIPTGLTIDHLCGVRLCVNPTHLEPVTLAENIRRAGHYNTRKTHCKRGHEFTPTNTIGYMKKNGHFQRQCRRCHSVLMAKTG